MLTPGRQKDDDAYWSATDGNPLHPSSAKEYLDVGANDSTDDAVHLRIERHLSELHHTNMNQTTFHVFYMPYLNGRTNRILKKWLPDIACCGYTHVHYE